MIKQFTKHVKVRKTSLTNLIINIIGPKKNKLQNKKTYLIMTNN